jgi:hypothetical protein
MTVTTYDNVVCICSQHHPGTAQWWWRIRGTDDILYATFESPNPFRPLREQAVLEAYASPTKAVAVTSAAINPISWISPFESPFTAPSEIPIVPRTDLSVLRRIGFGVDVVKYNGQTYIHKYMTASSTCYSFELEIQKLQ